MKKAHIPLTKCFALSDFGWGSLSPALPGPKARGQRRVYMIKWGQRVDAGRRCKRRRHMLAQLAPWKKEKESYKRQASSSKQRLTMVQGSCRMYIERYIMDNEQLKRIADAIEEILRLVKEDQERSKKYTTYSKNEDDFMGSENRIESE